MALRNAGAEASTTVNTSVTRTRNYLTGAEVDRLIAAARKVSRYGHRDATMILIAYRHGLRASEVCDLQSHQVELASGRLHVRRSKRGTPSVHPMQGDELRALRRLQREQGLSSHVFMSERDGPMTPKVLPCAIRSDRVAGQDAIPDTSAHAAAWLRLCPSQRRPRHQGATGLARPQEHPAHGALYRVGPGSVQGFLAMTRTALTGVRDEGNRLGWPPIAPSLEKTNP
jgi:integrase